jgi:hypothetical protein
MKQYLETDYYITETGEIFSRKYHPKKNPNCKLKQLKPTLTDKGYLNVCLYIDGKQIRKTTIHRLVGETFIPNPENYPQINHIDGNKSNNHVSNLEWCDRSYNMRHADKMGLRNNKGEKHKLSKLSEQQVLEIRELYSTGNYTQKELGEKFGVSQNQISYIINKKKWNHI